LFGKFFGKNVALLISWNFAEGKCKLVLLVWTNTTRLSGDILMNLIEHLKSEYVFEFADTYVFSVPLLHCEDVNKHTSTRFYPVIKSIDPTETSVECWFAFLS